MSSICGTRHHLVTTECTPDAAMTTPAPSDLMVRLARRFDAWPRELRWLVFLPAGIAAAFLVSSVLEAVLSAVGLRAISAQSTEGLTRGALLASASIGNCRSGIRSGTG